MLLDYFQAPAVTLYFVVTTIHKVLTLQKPSAQKVSLKKKRAVLAIILLLITSHVAQALLFISTAVHNPELAPPEHSVLRLMSNILLWGCLSLALFTSEQPVWYPHLGAWLVGAITEIALCVLSATGDRSAFNLNLFRVFCYCALLGLALMLALDPKADPGSDEERPLLGNETPESDRTAYGTAPKNAKPDKDKEIKDQQRKRLEAEGWVGYIKGFGMFIPHMWPTGDRKGQLCVLVIVIDIVLDRFLRVLKPRQMGIITQKLTEHAPMPWTDLLLWIMYQWLGSFAGWSLLRNFATTYVSNYSYRSIANLAFNHVMKLSMDFHSNKDSGEVLKAVKQASALNTLMEEVLNVSPVFIDLIVALFYVTHLFDIYVAFIILTFTIVYIWLGVTITTNCQSYRRTYSENNRAESKTVMESVTNWQTVAYFSRVPYERERYDTAINTMIDSQWSYIYRSYLGHALQNIVMTLGLAGGAILAAWEITSGRKPVGNFITLIMYWSAIVSPLTRLTYSFRYLSTTLIDAERVLQLLKTKPTVEEPTIPKNLVATAGRVEFKDVGFAYDERKPILKNVSFVAEPGQTVALVGETGGGKSTLLRLLFRFYDVTSGSITIDGQDVRDVSTASLREALGVVPQDPSLFNHPILDNVRYARLDATDDECYEACRAAAVHEKILSFPDGYQSKVGERGVKLSGGELQRLAIARVLVKEPRVVLLDEATSAVDSATEQTIQQAFHRLSAGRTTFVVAHRLSTIMTADVILVVDHGEIVERGTHEELLLKGGKYWELWTKQTLGRSGAPSSDAGEAKGGAAEALVNDLPAGVYTQELNRVFGAGAQEEQPAAVAPAEEEARGGEAREEAREDPGHAAASETENEGGSQQHEATESEDSK
jgi:ABC-type transport system involved in Fe-S cluster assembly fused permease/ATPase subunit